MTPEQFAEIRAYFTQILLTCPGDEFERNWRAWREYELAYQKGAP